MCIEAYNGPEGDQPGYDPFESNQGEGSDFDSNGVVGPHLKEVIPPGQICGAGRAKYANFNTPSELWPYSAHEPGATVDVAYTAWAHHPGIIEVFIPKENIDPTKTALGWDELQPEPISTFSTDTTNGYSEEHGAPTYNGTVTLPTSVANENGRGTLVFVWRRSDSPEVFYNCSDFKLEPGANGEVYNLLGANNRSEDTDDGTTTTTSTVPEQTTTTVADETTTTSEQSTTTDETPDSELLPGVNQLLADLEGKTFGEKIQAIILFLLPFLIGS